MFFSVPQQCGAVFLCSAAEKIKNFSTSLAARTRLCEKRRLARSEPDFMNKICLAFDSIQKLKQR
jgi:hypothetical protein